MMTALLSFYISLYFFHCLPDIFPFPFFFFSLLIVFRSSISLPPPSPSSYISVWCAVTAGTWGPITALTQQEPLFCLSPCFMGSNDRCTLDRRQKWMIAREIKAAKDNMLAKALSLSPSLCISLPHTNLLWLSLDTWGTLFSKWTQKFKAIHRFLCFMIGLYSVKDW